jgi:phosphatidylserine/phosphatidylglycerophosphate/cardiolipin synthase-like enzyme
MNFRLFAVFALICAAFLSIANANAWPSLRETIARTLFFPGNDERFQAGARYSLCFVPDGPSCQSLVIESIDETDQSLRIQAYSFTSPEIAAAVKRAKDRGVDVKVMLDKSQVSRNNFIGKFLRNAKIDVVVDRSRAVAHNSIMILDGKAVFTGSFDFTKGAQERNVENGVLIRGDAGFVKSYQTNWNARYRASSTH